MGWRLLPIRANGPRQLRHAFLPFACPPPDLFYFVSIKLLVLRQCSRLALHATMQPIGPSIGDARSVARCRSHWLQTSRAVQQPRAYQLVSYPRTTPPGQLPGRSARRMMPNLGAGTPHPPLRGDLSHRGRGKGTTGFVLPIWGDLSHKGRGGVQAAAASPLSSMGEVMSG